MKVLEVFPVENLAVAGAEPNQPKPEGMDPVAQLEELETSWGGGHLSRSGVSRAAGMETPARAEDWDPGMGLGHAPAPSPCSRSGVSQPGGAGRGQEPQYHAQTQRWGN